MTDAAAKWDSFVQSSIYTSCGAPDACLRLDDGTELPCHKALLCLSSGVFKDLLEGSPGCPAAVNFQDGAHAAHTTTLVQASAAKHSFAQCSTALTRIPVPGDSTEDWVDVLPQMYKVPHWIHTSDWGEAAAAIKLADKWNLPGVARASLDFINIQYSSGWPTFCFSTPGPWQYAKAAGKWRHVALCNTLAARFATAAASDRPAIHKLVASVRADTEMDIFHAKLIAKLLEEGMAKKDEANAVKDRTAQMVADFQAFVNLYVPDANSKEKFRLKIENYRAQKYI